MLELGSRPGASSLLAGNVTAIAEPAPLCLRPMEHGIGRIAAAQRVSGRARRTEYATSFVEVTININD